MRHSQLTKAGRHGIALKLVGLIVPTCAAMFAIAFGYSHFMARRIVFRHIQDSARNLAASTAHQIEADLRPVERVPRDLACLLEQAPYNANELNRFLLSAVRNNPEVFGSTVAFEPRAFDPARFYFAPYCYRNGSAIETKYLGGDDYRYHEWEWYAVPRETQKPAWTEPYLDRGGGGVLMATYSVPLWQTARGERAFRGVVTADVSLAWLQDLMKSIRIARSGYGFLISAKGTVITHPDAGLVMNRTLFEIARERHDPKLEALARDMTSGKAGILPWKSLVTEQECWLAYHPLTPTGWSVGVVFPQDELLADIRYLGRIVLAVGCAGFAWLLIATVFIARSIARPLRSLADATCEIAAGNLDFDVPAIRTRDEVGRLAESFAHMKDSLRRHIERLKATTAARERIEGELRIAHEIQMNILPKTFPAFPDRRDFDIYATLRPAKEVGGDLYDFFLLDDDHLCFCVGDVSGKGVPAALFMAVTKTLLKAAARTTRSPSEALTRVNDDVVQENRTAMFVTVFCGVLDLRTGRLEYSNAGHNPPFILRSDGRLESIDDPDGPVVGVIPGSRYGCRQTDLRPGDTLYLYTDGVTEAMNEHEELFTDARLRDLLARSRAESPRELVDRTYREVEVFCRNAPPSDDITVLALRFASVGDRPASPAAIDTPATANA